MDKVQHINLLDLDKKTLEHLADKREPYYDGKGNLFSQEEKEHCYHGLGYFIEGVIFVCFGADESVKYYRFLKISYLKNEVTYTMPFEVFEKTERIKRISYSNWIDKE